MTVKTTKKELLDVLDLKNKTTSKLGLVPTMGALHKGHFSLIDQAVKECDLVVVSIFINPTQFDNSSDLEKYPKNLHNDLEKLEEFQSELIVFAPSTSEIYNGSLQVNHYDFEGLDRKMEGAFRQGHFDGVGTVLSKFFTLIQPDRAYFGEKDYQQLLIVKKLIQILNLPIQIVGCPISREENGLARSSRNERLSPTQYHKATLLYKSLCKAKEEFGTKSVAEISKAITLDFEKDLEFNLDYFTIANSKTLEPATQLKNGEKYRAFIAAFLGDVRLIDNMALN